MSSQARNYPTPPSTLSSLIVSPSSDKSLELRSGSPSSPQESAHLEIEYLCGVGFCLEVRYDKSCSGVVRQPFTTAAPELPRAGLESEQTGATLSITAGDSTEQLIVNLADATITLLLDNSQVLNTGPHPFRRHERRQEIYEFAHSLRFWNFQRTFAETKSSYWSHMTEFRFEGPTGTILGLPGQTGEFNRNGYRFELLNTDNAAHIPDRSPLYQSWPILFFPTEDNLWCAVVHDNPSRTSVDLKELFPDRITFQSVTGNTRVYLLVASSLLELGKRVARLMGQPCQLPVWAFGYQQSRWSYQSEDEVLKVVEEFERHRIPLDTIYLDIHYMDGYRVFTSDPEAFPNLPKMVDTLRERGIKTVCIIDPGVKIDNQYPVYRELMEQGEVLRHSSGSPAVGNVWPGRVVYPDFGDQRTRDFWIRQQVEWLKATPFAGVWNDMNEPADLGGRSNRIADVSTARGPLEAEQNLYGYYMAKTSAEGFSEAKGDSEPGLIITRSGYLGVQKHAIIWHGDNTAWWEHLRLAIDTAITYSISGVPYTGADVPGFFRNPTDDLAIRFFQLGAFLPYFRGHSDFFARDKEPYAFSDEARALITEAIKLRYSLIPEWYEGYNHTRNTGEPLLMPSISDSGQVVRDQFLLFGKLLLAPVIERDAEIRSLYLPQGTWYKLGDTSTQMAGGRYLTITVDLSSVPVFVKSGSRLKRSYGLMNTSSVMSGQEWAVEEYP